jgi:hypothetical protein
MTEIVKCKECGKEFERYGESIYSPDLCGPHSRDLLGEIFEMIKKFNDM